MPIVVRAVSDEEFKDWVGKQTKIEDKYLESQDKPKDQRVMTRAELMNEGKAKYDLICAACHKQDGTGLSPLYPALKGSSVAVGKPISRHIEIILNGVSGTAMQPYREQFTDEEIAALVTYERNAWGNNTNDIIQPADVATVRQGNTQQPKMVNKARAGGLR
jgi:cytochrome c oxidase subunit 2